MKVGRSDFEKYKHYPERHSSQMTSIIISSQECWSHLVRGQGGLYLQAQKVHRYLNVLRFSGAGRNSCTSSQVMTFVQETCQGDRARSFTSSPTLWLNLMPYFWHSLQPRWGDMHSRKYCLETFTACPE